MPKWMLAVCMLVFGSAILQGCTKPKEEKANIRVMYWSEDSFIQRYGGFTREFPNIHVEVLSLQGLMNPAKDPEEEINKIIATEHPDVLLLGPERYEEMAFNGELFDLERSLKKDGFELDKILPVVIDMLKIKGNGKLYGLTPAFYSQVLYYNRKLFDANGISYPTDQMTWEDVLRVASQFSSAAPVDPQIYGLYDEDTDVKHNLFEIIRKIGMTKGLNYMDEESKKITLNNKNWSDVFQVAIDAVKSKAIYTGMKFNGVSAIPGSESEIKHPDPLFLKGRAAMSLGGYSLIASLEGSKISKDDWDFVTVPIDTLNPELSSSLNLSEVYAVNALSGNPEASSKLIQYMNSEEDARRFSSSAAMLSSRIIYSLERDGHSLKAFYSLKMNAAADNRISKLAKAFSQAFDLLAGDQIIAVINGKRSLEEALKEIEEQGQVLLNQFN